MLEIPSVLNWLFRAGLSALAKAAWERLRPDDLDARLRSAVERWAAALPEAAAVQPVAMFPPHLPDDVSPDSTPTELRRLRQKLLAHEMPMEDDWFYALAEHWGRRKDELGEDGQPFFRRDFDAVEPHLRALAHSLNDVCTQDATLFRAMVLRLLPQVTSPEKGLELSALEVRDGQRGRYYAEVEIKVLNTGSTAIFITSVEIEVEKMLLFEHMMPRFMQVPVSGVYDLVVAPEDVPGTIQLPVAQVVYPNDADRFVVRVSIDPECPLLFREAICLVRGELVESGERRTPFPEHLLCLPWPRRILGQRGTRDTARAAAQKNVMGLEKLLSETSAARSPRTRELIAEVEGLKVQFGVPPGAA